MKYKQNKQLIHEMFLHLRPTSLAKILLITERHKNTILVPVPLHPNRERERGYNQSSYITRLLSALTHIPITEHAIERVRETLPQAQCKSKKERLHNIHGAFLVIEPSALEGKTIMLVDDVVTTGSTIREITREIHKHTSSSTLALCLAREEDSEKYHRI
jgi:ComF family protein